MPWKVEYFEASDGGVPGERFEDALEASRNPDVRDLLNLLRRWVEYAADEGPLGHGGGHFEKCRDVAVWQVKATTGNRRGRWFFGWDHRTHRLVLLSGIVKEPKKPTPPRAYARAEAEWHEYQTTRRVAKEDQ